MRQPYNVLVIPFRRAPELRFCVLQRTDAGWWQWVSGGVEEGESVVEAALREAEEELGVLGTLFSLDMQAFVPRTAFSAHQSWPKDQYFVEEHAFAMELASEDVALSHEHSSAEWLDYEAAFQRLHWQSNQTALWELAERIRDETLSVIPIGEYHPG